MSKIFDVRLFELLLIRFIPHQIELKTAHHTIIIIPIYHKRSRLLCYDATQTFLLILTFDSDTYI